ncbi:MAG: DUF3108 domain-containing protein [Bacteroidota bacterium]
MKRLILTSAVLLTIMGTASAQLRKVNNTAFQRGEKMIFKVYYDAALTGKVTAGIATFEVTDENKKIANRNTMRIVGVGETKGAFNYFFKVVDRYETFIDEETLAPWIFIRRMNEGGYKIKHDVTFNQYKNIATTNKHPSVKTTPYIHDIISAFYFSRLNDYTFAKIGQEYPLDFFLDDTVWNSKIKFVGRETIKTSMGTFKCLKFKPSVLTGNVFKENYPMTLWVTDDKNKLPILAESGVLVGTVKLELIRCTGLKNPQTSKLN